MTVVDEELVRELVQAGCLAHDRPRVEPLAGGVSSDIVLLDDGRQPVVLKRALAKLKVQADWFADVSRNGTEQRYFRYVSRFLPQAVPRILWGEPDRGCFVMEYLAEDYRVWKEALLAGVLHADVARQAGELLGLIHRHSGQDPRCPEQFATLRNFHQLRLEPYLLHTAGQHPDIAPALEAEADRLSRTAEVLVHGDFSPKNLLVRATAGRVQRLVILDAEVAWFGDPSFDTAFLLNHLLLKGAHRPALAGGLQRLAETFWRAYLTAMPAERHTALDRRTAWLLPMLLLARIDGKSPVEYLTEPARSHVRQFARNALRTGPVDLATLITRWTVSLSPT